MSDAVGKLDGLREIIAPLAPVQTDYPVWPIVFLTIGILLLIYLVIKYHQHPLSKARRLFHLLNRHGHDWNAMRCGDCLSHILRYCQIAGRVESSVDAVHLREECKFLQDDCNQLRFSGKESQPETFERAMERTRKLLWPAS